MIDLAAFALGLRVLALAIFGYAAWSDLRLRSCPNGVWVVLLAVGIIALAIDATVTSSGTVFASAAVIFIAISALSISAFGQGWIGGADAKAAMSIPILYPKPPGLRPEETLSAALGQGVEIIVWLWIVTAVLGLAWPVTRRLNIGAESDGIPFLVPLFGAILTLYLSGLPLPLLK